MRKEDIDALRSLPLFAEVDEKTFERIISPSFMQSFPPKTVLLKENEPADFLYVILDGLVLMSAKSNEGETALEILRAVDVFILAAVLNDDVCLQTAQTLVTTRVLMVPATLVRDLMSDDTGFMRAIVFETACAYRRLVKELKTQKLRNSVQRLTNWIVKEALSSAEPDIVVIPYEKRILAAYLGMTPENLSRSFASLRLHGVSIEASTVRIINNEKLKHFAAQSQLIASQE